MTNITKRSDELGELTKDQIGQLAQAGIIPKNTPPAQVAIFAQICKEKGLSPFQKHIYLVGYGNKYNCIMGIDGYRAIAARSGVHAGTDEVLFNGDLTLSDCIKEGIKAPATATCTVWKVVAGFRVGFTHTVSFNEFKGSQKWNTMPFQMLAKVAESFALRKAFPEELAGLNIHEESSAMTNDSVYQKDEQEVEIDTEHSKRVLNDAIESVRVYDDWEVLKNDALQITTQAESNGISSEHLETLKKFIKKHFTELKTNNND